LIIRPTEGGSQQRDKDDTNRRKRLAVFLQRSPDIATAEDIRRFQLYLAESGMSVCNRNRTMTGLRFLFRVTLRRLDLAEEFYHIKEPQKVPLNMGPRHCATASQPTCR